VAGKSNKSIANPSILQDYPEKSVRRSAACIGQILRLLVSELNDSVREFLRGSVRSLQRKSDYCGGCSLTNAMDHQMQMECQVLPR
jgi:hypothetical protein